MSTQINALIDLIGPIKDYTPEEIAGLQPLISAMAWMVRTGRPLPRRRETVLAQLGCVYSRDKFVPLDQASFHALVDRGIVVIEDPRGLTKISFPEGVHCMSVWNNIPILDFRATDFSKLAGVSALVAYLLKQSKHPCRMDVVYGWENGHIIRAALDRVTDTVTIGVPAFLPVNKCFMVMRKRGGDES